jgi:stage II sporulation protein D
MSNPNAAFELINDGRVVAWKGSGNYNKYRGALEYRHGEVNPDLWVVNDLLFEDYMKGVAENSNGAPIEYLKAQSVAQRSYAYATQQADKYGIFDVVATTGDQLYLGYNSEAQMPNFLSAVQATRGYMVTYDNAIVQTPYFANTDGRTRSWQEVWGANRPWLVSVKCEYDNGRRLLGHGVGMSQLDASARAKAEGLAWQELVKYYYTGVEVERIYD